MKPAANKHSRLISFISMALLLLFGIVIIGISIYGVPDKRDVTTSSDAIPEVFVGETANAIFRLIQNETALRKDTKSTFRIEINTASHAVDSADIVIKYDKNRVRVDGNPKTDGVVFNKYVNTYADNSNGIIRVSGLFTSLEQTYNGTGYFANIEFTPLSKDEIQFTIDCANSGIYKRGDNVFTCRGSEGALYTNISDGTGGGSPSIPTTGSEPYRGPWCTKEYPSRPTNLVATTGVKPGTVKLTWTRTENTTHYTVTFGEKWMDFKYGSPNIGNTDQFLVTGLRPGVLYYFVVTSVNDCASSGYSDGAKAVAGKATYSGGTGSTVRTTPRPTVAPRATLAPTSTPFILETPPQATSSGLYDDWDTESWNQPTPTVEPVATIAPSEQGGGSLLLTLAKILPWIGLVVLVILGIMLVRFIRGGNDQELPPLQQNFNAEGEQMVQDPQVPQAPQDMQGYVQPQEPQQSPQDPLAPPFRQ